MTLENVELAEKRKELLDECKKFAYGYLGGHFIEEMHLGLGIQFIKERQTGFGFIYIKPPEINVHKKINGLQLDTGKKYLIERVAILFKDVEPSDYSLKQQGIITNIGEVDIYYAMPNGKIGIHQTESIYNVTAERGSRHGFRIKQNEIPFGILYFAKTICTPEENIDFSAPDK